MRIGPFIIITNSQLKVHALAMGILTMGDPQTVAAIEMYRRLINGQTSFKEFLTIGAAIEADIAEAGQQPVNTGLLEKVDEMVEAGELKWEDEGGK